MTENRESAVELFTTVDSMINSLKNFKRDLREVVKVRKARTTKSVATAKTKRASVTARADRSKASR